MTGYEKTSEDAEQHNRAAMQRVEEGRGWREDTLWRDTVGPASVYVIFSSLVYSRRVADASRFGRCI